MPIQWKGMTTTTFNGTMVHVHEIANTGQPILDGKPRHSLRKFHDADASMHLLSVVLQHSQIMTRDRQRRCALGEQSHVVVLHGADAIRIVKYSG
jgi:hypothetical protein